MLQLRIECGGNGCPLYGFIRADQWAAFSFSPRPCVAEPQGRQHPELRIFRAAIKNSNFDEDVVRGFFGVLHKHIKVAVIIEYPRVDQFILEFVA